MTPLTILTLIHTRVLDADGRTVERTTARPDADGILRTESVMRWAYDAAGRVIEERTSWGDAAEASVQSYRYDGAGRLVYESWSYDGSGEPDGWIDTVYDGEGRWIEKSTYTEGQLYRRFTRTFACE